MEDFDLREMVEGVAEGVASSAQATGVSVACSFARDVQAARRGDRECVEEILTELLASASSSTKEGYVIVRVDGPGPGDATDDVIVITVEDTGDGSNPAVLASVEKLIHRVGGTIWLEHPAEKGTKVRCSFPLAHARVAAPSPSVDELAGKRAAVFHRSPVVAEAIVEMLADLGIDAVAQNDTLIAMGRYELCYFEDEAVPPGAVMDLSTALVPILKASQDGASGLREPVRRADLIRATRKALGLDRPAQHARQ